MKTRKFITALVTAPALFVTLVAADGSPCRVIDDNGTPTDPSDDVLVCTLEAWFAPAGTDVGNVGATGLDDFPSWDTTPPATDPNDSGSTYLAAPYVHESGAPGTPFDPTLGATFEGTYTGPLSDIYVDLWMSTTPGFVSGYIQIAIDDQIYYETDTDAVDLPQVGSPVRRVLLALTDIYPSLRENGDIGSDTQHTIKVHITPDRPSEFRYDASAFSSRIVFNPVPGTFDQAVRLQAS